MALTERQETLMEILPDGHIQVREDTIIERDGVVIARTPHRHVLSPGDDTTNENDDVKAIAAVVHTAEKVAAYQAKQNANENSPVN